jgi:hypothetical protein
VVRATSPLGSRNNARAAEGRSLRKDNVLTRLVSPCAFPYTGRGGDGWRVGGASHLSPAIRRTC